MYRIFKYSVYLIVAIITCFCMNSCVKIKAGEVINKRFDPAHDEHELVQYGDIWVNETYHVPNRWFITIGKKCEDNKYRTNEVQVSEEIYNETKIGQWMNFNYGEK